MRIIAYLILFVIYVASIVLVGFISYKEDWPRYISIPCAAFVGYVCGVFIAQVQYKIRNENPIHKP